MADSDPLPERDEQGVVEMRRFQEAYDAGLSEPEAWIFAVCGADVGILRRLVREGCSPSLIGRIIL